jgi:integrase/recombinase XerC
MYGSGLRVSEVAALDREDVDLHAGLLTVRSGKGRKGRVVPVGGPEAAALTAWLGERGGHAGALFLNRSGQRLSVRGLYDIVRKAGIAAGIGGLHPHALRHAFATHLLGGGADIRSIQDMLGHASLATTQRYAAVDVQLLMDTWRKAHPHAGRPEPG